MLDTMVGSFCIDLVDVDGVRENLCRKRELRRNMSLTYILYPLHEAREQDGQSHGKHVKD
jgi:hypothetical protein